MGVHGHAETQETVPGRLLTGSHGCFLRGVGCFKGRWLIEVVWVD